LIRVAKNKTPERLLLSGVWIVGQFYTGNWFYTGNYWLGVVVGLLNLECPQQNRANENEHGAHGAHGEHIQSQGKVHG